MLSFSFGFPKEAHLNGTSPNAKHKVWSLYVKQNAWPVLSLSLYNMLNLTPFHGYVEHSPIPKAIYSTLSLSGMTLGQNCCLDNPLHQLDKSAYVKKRK